MKVSRTAVQRHDVRDFTKRVTLVAETEAESWALAKFVGTEAASPMDSILGSLEAEYEQNIIDQKEPSHD